MKALLRITMESNGATVTISNDRKRQYDVSRGIIQGVELFPLQEEGKQGGAAEPCIFIDSAVRFER